jgi:NADPH2:quinone reductase
VHAVVEGIFRDIARGDLEVLIDREYPLSEAADAHRRVLSREALGRVLLRP